jgi:hypothetical protein
MEMPVLIDKYNNRNQKTGVSIEMPVISCEKEDLNYFF